MSFAEPQLRVKKVVQPPPVPKIGAADYDKAAIKECNNRQPPSSTEAAETDQTQISFEVIKEGVQAGLFTFEAADFLAVGRQPPENEMIQNFMHMEHPSLSRRHAVFLKNRRTSEVFLHDHGSTHGTQLNYKPVTAFKFYEVQDGDIVRFGESTRIVVVHIDSPDSQSDSDSDGQEGAAEIQNSGREQAGQEGAAIKENKPSAAASYQARLEQALIQGQKVKQARAQLQKELAGGGGASWGMDFEGDDQVQALQANLDRLDNQADAEGADEGARVEDAELIRDLDTEALKARMGTFTDKQQQIITKVLALRHKVTVSTNAEQVSFNLTQEEERLRTSLKSSKGWRKNQKEGEDSDSEEDAARNRLVDSGDESDEFFDRTDKQKVTQMANAGATSETQSYPQLKAQMEALCAERLSLTEQLHRAQKGQIAAADEADELDAFMAQNASSLQAETCAKLAKRLTSLKEEITKCSNLLALVAPVDLNKQKATVLSKPEQQSQPAPADSFAVQEKEKPQVKAAALGSSISDAIQRIKARQQELAQQHKESERKKWQQLKEQEAAAFDQVPPELEQAAAQEASDDEAEADEVSDAGSEGGVVVQKAGLKRLFKQIVKNANNSDKVDVNKEYAPLMQKYIERTKLSQQLSAAHGGILNTKITDGLNIQAAASIPEDDGEAEGYKVPAAKRSRYGAQVAPQMADRVAPGGSKDADVEDWVPPVNQSGDGKTSLNAKFGY